jgi:hypothetical protein
MDASSKAATQEPPAATELDPPLLLKPSGPPAFAFVPEWGLQPFYELQVGLDAGMRTPTINIPHFADAILRGALDNGWSVKRVIAEIVLPHAKEPGLDGHIGELVIALFFDEKRVQTVRMLERDGMLGYRESERRAILLYAKMSEEAAARRLLELLA